MQFVSHTKLKKRENMNAFELDQLSALSPLVGTPLGDSVVFNWYKKKKKTVQVLTARN